MQVGLLVEGLWASISGRKATERYWRSDSTMHQIGQLDLEHKD